MVSARTNGLDGDAKDDYIRRAMKTFLSSLLLLGFLGAGSGRAGDLPPALNKGKILILKNEYTMEGDIERVGDRYRVRRKVGDTWMPVERVLFLAASLPDAYAYLRGRINRDDADERLRLARWCRANGLREQELTELQAAVSLRPDHAETRRLLQHWKQTEKPTTTLKPAAMAPAAEGLPAVEVTSEALGLFATRVQPILMNTCASCHATGRGGKFRLTQVYGDSIGNRQILERNLAAVLAEVDLNQPEASRLLLKAVSDHGHIGRPPLRNRQLAPYRTLESWIKQTVAGNPQLRDALPHAPSASAPSPLSFGDERRSANQEASPWGVDARLPARPPSSPAVRGEKVAASPLSPTPPPPALSTAYETIAEQARSNSPSESASGGAAISPRSEATSKPASKGPPDPYDPELFNQKMHPEVKQSGPDQ